MQIVTADFAQDHARLLAIAKTHPATSAFGHIMFSAPETYAKGWIRKAVDEMGQIVGFTCVRHKVREASTSLYYIVVDPHFHRKGVGQLLLNDLIATTPHRCIKLSCEIKNSQALAFYAKNGFTVDDTLALKGKGAHLSKTW